MGSNPVRVWIFLVNFSSIRKWKETYFVSNSYRKVAPEISIGFNDKMFLTVLLYALKKKYLKDNEKNITEANIQGLWSVL